MRLIDADAILQELGCYNCAFHETPECESMAVCRGRHKLIEAPTIDPVKHGHWVKHELINRIHGVMLYDYQCDQCKTFHDYDTEFCPHCGAEMAGAAE